MPEVALTLLITAVFSVVVIAGTYFGLIAGWLIVLAFCVWLVMLAVTLCTAVIAVFRRAGNVYRRHDCYAEPIGDYPKVPHGR